MVDDRRHLKKKEKLSIFSRMTPKSYINGKRKISFNSEWRKAPLKIENFSSIRITSARISGISQI
jgi:hypothetical protein